MKVLWIVIKTFLILTVAIVILFAALYLYVSGGKSLTRQQITVWVNDVEHVDGAIAKWGGSQYFDIITRQITARIRIIPYNTEGYPYLMTALVKAVNPGTSLIVDSIQFRLVYADSKHQTIDIRLSPRNDPPLIENSKSGQVKVWSQFLWITEDLSQFPDRSMELTWSMDYRDGDGEIKHLSVTVPLRKVDVIIPTSLVRNFSDDRQLTVAGMK